jgi:hypothetical protein
MRDKKLSGESLIASGNEGFFWRAGLFADGKFFLFIFKASIVVEIQA